MGEILVRFTDMEIVRVDDRAPIQEDLIYLIPARHDIRLAGYALHADPQSKKRSVQHPINVSSLWLNLARAAAHESQVPLRLIGSGGIASEHEQGFVLLRKPKAGDAWSLAS